MSREVEWNADKVCDGCGSPGSFDYMGDNICGKCISRAPQPRTLYVCRQCKEDVAEGEQDNGACPHCGSETLIPYGECDEDSEPESHAQH